jgi:hypothetical protein
MNSEIDRSAECCIADSFLVWIGVALIENASKVWEGVLSILSALLELATKNDDNGNETKAAEIEMPKIQSMKPVVEGNAGSFASEQKQLPSMKSLIGRIYAS